MSLNNKIDMVSVEDISGFEFFIPKYQRGYRWNRQQVTDLLIDLYDYFIVRKETTDYSLQPLVVKRRIKNYSILKGRVNSLLDNTSDSNLCINELEHLISKECQWEVIDGQQRVHAQDVGIGLLPHIGAQAGYVEVRIVGHYGVFAEEVLPF